MFEKEMQELEQATQIVLAPPNVVTSEQRHAAENIILEFRKTKLPYNTCRFILENSTCDYVLFQAATTVKESVIREWSLLSAEDIESLRSFLLRFITQHITLQSYVREQILQTVAVILKRGTIDTKGASRDSLFEDVTQLVASGNVTMQLVACSMLTALLNEYSSSSRTSSVGFTWEFHTRCKRAFEENDLKRVFLFALQVLYELDKQPTPLAREAVAVLNRLLSIAEQVLCWEFTPKTIIRRHIGSFEMNQNAPLKPNSKWRQTLLDKNMVDLFFRMHKKVRHNSDMAHHSMQCLSQLASLNGPIFPDDKARHEYLNSFIAGFIQLLTSSELQDFEYFGISNIFKNLVMLFPLPCFMALPKELMEAFIDQLTRLTCAAGREAALEEAQGMDATTEEDEIDEIEEDDRDRFADQLCSIGVLGRMVPQHSIPLLAKVLEDRISRLHGHLQRMLHLQHQQQTAVGSHGDALNTAHINILHEDIHWIVLVAAHVLTEEAEGETPMIPTDIMQFSMGQASTVDINTTLKVLASPGERVDAIPGGIQGTDPVVRLISAVFRLCEVEKRAIEANLSACLSPQVSSTVIWFLCRWVVSYLLPDENYYSQISHALLSAFGRDTDGAQWTVTFLLEKILANMIVWNSEEKLVTDTMQLLNSLVESRSSNACCVYFRAVFVVKSDMIWTLAKQEASHQHPFNSLCSAARKYLLKGLVLAGSGFKDNQLQEEYYNYVLKSLHDRFMQTVCQADFSKKISNTDVKSGVLDLLDSLCGVAMGTRVDNLDRLFNFLHPLLSDSVKLLDLYHNYEDVVPLVLELFSEVMQKQLCYLGESNSRKLYELCLSAIQVYSKHNIGKRTSQNDDEEEDRYNDILLVIELLTNLLSKDFIDFSDPEEGVPQSGGQVSAADVVLYGLNTIIPIMDANLLKLCLETVASLATETFQAGEVGTRLHESMAHYLKIVFHMLLLETFNMDLLETASTSLFCLICCHQEQYKHLVNELLQNQVEPSIKERLLEAFNNLTPASLNMTINRQSKIAFMQNFDQFLINVRGFLCVR
ncbi:hypothetical protein KUTeg_007214 [Tegillarca granosa]|uniref:Exportin-4 n=1 Tax=Tegillarca granosa TaxID=220873 RepID=A0ABQ9FCM0_TEGGR|nr:hypothetical protein KUTeg_007214 [Tegillarca granosa]